MRRGSKAYFLQCFIASCLLTIFWTFLVVFAFLGNSIAVLGALVFFWGAKQMLDGYRGRL